MGGRCHVKPDHIAQLFGKGLVVRQLELAPAMRGKTMRLPDALHGRGRKPGPPFSPSPEASSASRPAAGWLGSGGSPPPSCPPPSSGCRAGGSSRARGRQTPSVMNRACQRQTQVFDTRAAHQRDPCPPDVLLRRRCRRNNRLKTETLTRRSDKLNCCAPHPESHIRMDKGIQIRTPSFRSIH